MNFLGLNSPEIFVISVIILIILGPKRVEKGWLLFQRLLKFLLSNKEDISKDKLNLGSQLNLKQEVIAAKEEVVEAKSEKQEVIAAKEEVVEPNLKRKKSKPKKIPKE
jgi:Sec-independent protein translocase protein TatA